MVNFYRIVFDVYFLNYFFGVNVRHSVAALPYVGKKLLDSLSTLSYFSEWVGVAFITLNKVYYGDFPMVREKDLDVTELANTIRIRQMLNRVKKNGNHYIVKDKGEPLAILLPLAEIDEWKRDKEKAWQNLFKVMNSVHARNTRFSAAEVEADVDAAIRGVRRGRK